MWHPLCQGEVALGVQVVDGGRLRHGAGHVLQVLVVPVLQAQLYTVGINISFISRSRS